MKVDVIVVGGRCAGSVLALRLARAGARVAIVDRDELGSDTLSTHAVLPSILARLDTRLAILQGFVAAMARSEAGISAHFRPFPLGLAKNGVFGRSRYRRRRGGSRRSSSPRRSELREHREVTDVQRPQLEVVHTHRCRNAVVDRVDA